MLFIILFFLQALWEHNPNIRNLCFVFLSFTKCHTKRIVNHFSANSYILTEASQYDVFLLEIILCFCCCQEQFKT